MKSTFFYTLLLSSVFSLNVCSKLHAAAPEPSRKTEFLGQKQSSITWGDLPTESFLSFKEWKEESDIRDQVPDWEKILRERNHRELAGRIYQCVGTCRIDRGASFFNGTYRTGLFEGDEIQTIGDSYAWIFLFDGTMIRLSPSSSITINELNIGVKENFINARINSGNVLWLSRLENPYQEVDVRETDISFFPYSEYESLPVADKKSYIEDDLIELISKNSTNINQYKNLNEKISINNNMTKNKKTYSFVVTPNSTFMGESLTAEFVVFPAGKTYFKRRSQGALGLIKNDEPSTEIMLQLRGFENKGLTNIQEDLWIEIDEKGRSYAQGDNLHWLEIGEFITKRIPSLMLGREIFLEKYSAFAFIEKYDPVKLAKTRGYRLWGELAFANDQKDKSDLQLRLEFLKEYFRRVETSNLLTSSRFRDRLAERGEKMSLMEAGNYFYISALNRYYQAGEKNLDISGDKETGEVLNSTKKLLWKKMHGIR